MRTIYSYFSFNAVRYLYKHNYKKQTKMQLRLDGSEASMLPILIEKSNLLIGQSSKSSLFELAEFSVGRGIADLFVVKTDKRNLKKRKDSSLKPSTDLSLYQNCISDPNPISIIDRSVAIEAKVRDWRKGLKQAMRYKSFADKSYLAVYESHVSKPLEYLDIFRAMNIGLISVSDCGVNVHYEPLDNKIDYRKSLLASERAFSIIDNAQNSFVVRNQLTPNSVPA